MEQGKAGWSDTYRHKHMHTNMHSQWIGKRCSCVELRLFLIDWNWTVLTGTAVLSFGCPWLNSPYWSLLVQLCWAGTAVDWTVLTGTAVSLTEQSLLVQLCWALAVPDWTVLTGTAVLSFGCPWLNSPYWYSCVELWLSLTEQSLLVQQLCPWLELWLSLTEQSLLVQLCWALAVPDWTVLTGTAVLSLLAVPDWTVLTGTAVLSFGCPWLNSPYWCSCIELWLSLTEQSLLVQLCWALAVPDWTVLTGAAVLSFGCPWLNSPYWYSCVELWLSLTEQSLLVQLYWAWAVPDWTVLTGTAVLSLLSFGCPWLNSPYWCTVLSWLSLTEQSLLVQLYWALAVPDWTVLTGAAVLSFGCPWLNSPYW